MSANFHSKHGYETDLCSMKMTLIRLKSLLQICFLFEIAGILGVYLATFVAGRYLEQMCSSNLGYTGVIGVKSLCLELVYVCFDELEAWVAPKWGTMDLAEKKHNN